VRCITSPSPHAGRGTVANGKQAQVTEEEGVGEAAHAADEESPREEGTDEEGPREEGAGEVEELGEGGGDEGCGGARLRPPSG
jgi:hypothetical protein